ncbi:MAG: ParA family protein [Acidobacteriota bacterium]
MRVVTLINKKGGVGKTTFAVNLSVGFANRGYHVVVLDLDAQADCSTVFLPDSPHLYAGSCDFLTLPDQEFSPSTLQTLLEPVPLRADRGSLKILPASEHLSTAPEVLQRTQRFNVNGVLRKRLALSDTSGIDLILVDVAPAWSIITANGFLAADLLWMPSDLSMFGESGIATLLDFRQQVEAQLDYSPSIGAILPNNYSTRTRRSRDGLANLRDTFGERVSPPIRNSTAIGEATDHKQDIWTFDSKRRTNGPGDFELVLDFLEPQIAQEETP